MRLSSWLIAAAAFAALTWAAPARAQPPGGAGHYVRNQHTNYDHAVRDTAAAYNHYARDVHQNYDHALRDSTYRPATPSAAQWHYYNDQRQQYNHYQADRHQSYDHSVRDRGGNDYHYRPSPQRRIHH